MTGGDLGYARKLERRGDDAVYRGELRNAKAAYGRAIDSYLESDDNEGAIRTCRKLLRLTPDVVRTRFTLTCLLVAQRKVEEALDALSDYVRSVHETGTRSHAVPRLVVLGSIAEESILRDRIASALYDLGAPREGESILSQPGRSPVTSGQLQAEEARTRRDQLFRLVRL